MSDIADPNTSRKTMPAWGGLVLLVIGGIAGAIGATMVVRTIGLRHAYPRAVMTLMNVHVSVLKKSVYQGQCAATDSSLQLQRLDTLASNIQTAFKARDGSPFMHAEAQLQNALDKARATPLSDCAALRTALSPINDACEDCHTKFR